MTARFDNSDGRIRGRKLQERRLKVWSKDPRCAMCRKLVEFSARLGFGFQLDHRIALTNGGEDTEANCQVLCIGIAGEGCHERKTAQDLGQRYLAPIGLEGWPL